MFSERSCGKVTTLHPPPSTLHSPRIAQEWEVGWGGVQGSKIAGVEEAMEVSRKFVAENMKQ